MSVTKLAENIASRRLILGVLFIDVLLIFLHLTLGEDDLFNLDRELNLPTFFQVIKVAVIAGMFFILAQAKPKLRTLSRLMGVIFAYLAIDELFQVHELVSDLFHRFLLKINATVGFAAWLIPYAPVMVAAFLVFAFSFQKIFNSGSVSPAARNWFIVGVFCFAMVPVVELVGTLGWDLEGADYMVTVAFEEGFELLGATSFLAAVLLRRPA